MSAPQPPLAGWGLTAATIPHELVRPTHRPEVASTLAVGHRRGTIGRGLGRGYGDLAQRGGGRVIDTTGLDGIGHFDRHTGVLRVNAGASLSDVLAVVVPQGWFVPVTPGTRFVTIGGMVAADVHGKNHHADGTFGTHVRSLELACTDGSVRTLSPSTTPEAFWATVGGLGLTGLILEVTVQLKAIPSSRLAIDTSRLPDLDTLLSRLVAGQNAHRYSVAWIDLMAKGASLGRSVLTEGDFAPAEMMTGRAAEEPFAYRPRPPLQAPPIPGRLLNRVSIQVFNELWFRKAPKARVAELQSIAQFFHPLDMLNNWNTLYGRRGFLQWQCLLPFGAESTLQRCIAELVAHRCPSFLAVLKTFGAENAAPLSFPGPGWTLALDVPVSAGPLADLLDQLDRWVAEAGGRIYLAKDSRMNPTWLATTYPRLDEWRSARDDLDPERQMRSDLSERLGLLGAPASR